MKVETAGFARTAVSSLPSLIESRVSLNHRRGYHFEPKRLPSQPHNPNSEPWRQRSIASSVFLGRGLPKNW
jgi:hypothetical protein